MKTRTAVWSVALIFSCFILWACVAGQENFKMGERLGNAQRWEEAIPFYEKAARENPNNNEFRAALKRARSEAAKVPYAKAQGLLAGTPEPSIPALEVILRETERACAYDPENKEIDTFRKGLLEKREDIIGKIRALYANAGEDLENQNWFEAVTKLREVNRLYPGYEETADKLATAEERGAEYFYMQGLALAREEEWKMAAQAFKTVMDISPGYHDAQSLYDKAKSNDSIDYYIQHGQDAAKRQEWEKAALFLSKALDYQPDNETIIRALETCKAKAGERQLNQAIKMTAENKLSAALSHTQRAAEYDPSLAETDVFKKCTESLSKKLYKRAESHVSEQEWGNALVWLTKLGTVNPEYEGLFHLSKSVKDNIIKRIKKSIAVFDFSSPSTDPDAGRIVANKLITFLYEKASGDLRIIERENLQSILKELQLGQTGLVDIQTAQQVGKMRGINTFILGDVLHFTSSTKDFPSSKTVMIQVGTKRVKTRDFLEWEARHPNPSREELKQAPTAYEDQPIFERFSYKVGTTKILAFLEISYKMVDTATGENLFTDTIAGKLDKQDTYNDGVPAGANIQFDPLELPSEVEVLSELTDEKVAEMGLSILKHFQSLELEYFREAEKLLKRREYGEAIEKYTDAIFDEKLKGISSPIQTKASEMIGKLTKEM